MQKMIEKIFDIVLFAGVSIGVLSFFIRLLNTISLW